MRQGQQNSNRNNNRQRSRGRRPNNSGGGGGNAANKVYDSNGPDVRVRGSAQTVADKYLQLAGDAQSQGDRIKTESYFQHAEHYLRIVAANQAVVAQKQAEKEKAAEEHAARIAAKKAKAAAEQEAAPQEAAKQESVPQTKPEADKVSEIEKNDDWSGPQPAFLKRDDAPVVEKPKKPRRKPAKKKPVEATNGNGVEVATAVSTDDSSVEIRSSSEEQTVPSETPIIS